MMKNYLRKSLVAATASLISFAAMAQCPTITCPGNISVSSDPGNCSAVVTYSAPVVADPCSIVTTTFNYSGSIVTWTVPAGVTSVHMQVKGAQGGHNNSSTTASGLGADISGDFSVTPGAQYKILVGQQPSATSGNGGGGGSFVTDMSNNPVIIAGGGGGSSQGADSPAKNGQAGTTGGTGAGGGGVGGTAGSGGSVGGAGFQSGAGGGLLTNGADGWTTGTGGFAFVNGGSGGTTNAPANGGFGGGGSGSSYVVGGGGGGYSGGGSGGNSTAGVGGGGGSYNSGTNQVNTGGANSGNGVVIISYTTGSSLTTTMTSGLASGSTFPVGTTTQNFLVDDGNGHTATCSFDVVVTDNEAPAIVAPADITVNSDPGNCSAVVTFTAPVGTDNCSGATTALTAGLASGSAFPVGTTVETFTATDASGNTANASFTITVLDAEAPAIVAPADVTVSNDAGVCGAVVTFTPPVGTDNCSGATTALTAGLASGSLFPVGTTVETFTATDAAGNSSSASFNVIVNDTEAPVFASASDIIVGNDAGQCTAVVNFTDPASTDNCSVASTALVAGLTSGSAFPIGTTVETITATDASGNTSSVSFNIIVNDMESPMISCGNNVTSCSAVVSNIDPVSVTDNCNNYTVTYTLSGATAGAGNSSASGVTFNTGTTTVTYTVTDGGGNMAVCSFDVTVFAAPTITATAASNTVCAADAPVALTGSPVGGTWSGTGVTGTTFNPSVAGTGAHVLTYTFTDANGCTNSATTTVTVNACTGVDDPGFTGNSIRTFPNPNAGEFSITVNAELKDMTIEITDAVGKVVYASKENDVHAGYVKEISLDQMSNGVYMMRISANGETRTEKIIVQK